MKLIIFALACVAIAAAVPVEQEPEKILRSDFDVKPDGAYAFGFETEKGIRRQEEGQVKEVLDENNKPRNVVVVRGEYSYTNVEGKPETISYYADESGYHAEGDSIPKPVRK